MKLSPCMCRDTFCIIELQLIELAPKQSLSEIVIKYEQLFTQEKANDFWLWIVGACGG